MASRTTITALALGLLCLCTAAVFGQTPERVPHLGDAGQQAYQNYLTVKPNRAFVITEGGGYGTGFESPSPGAAIQNAMPGCRRRDPNGSCKVYSLNGHVVWGMSNEEALRHVAAQVPAGRVPYINAAGQQDFERVRNAGFHRAFFISESGAYGAGTNASTHEAALRTGKQNCEKRDPNGCKLYMLDGHIVWGKDPDSFPRYADAPKYGRFIPSDYTPVLGPEKAKGLVVWSHGYRRGSDATASQPHGYISRFLAAGWDVYRFNREWAQTEGDIADMIPAVEAAKKAGYAKVILAGQSHGAWSSLAALGRGAKADAVIATAPAKHGEPPSREARQDFRALMRDVRSRNADSPVIVTLFQDDGFDPGGRFVDVNDMLGGTSIPYKLIDRPTPFKGHGAGDENRFNDVWGRCIFSFTTRTPTAAEDCK